ncbi:PEGA domain-containing protein [Candidatus Parcubacteria bacterium]|nr:PEGA domain-containing protein [Candidatus Parcubacteria bacterium]
MKLATRRFLFWLSIGFFVVLAPLVIGYAIGYRFDFSEGGLVRTGALFVEAEPKRVEIIIDGKPTKRTGTIITNSTFVRDLAPGRHRVRLEKESYQPWEKELEIRPAVVTEVRGARLWPAGRAPENVAVLGQIDPGTLRPSPDGRALVWASTSGRVRTWLKKDLPDGQVGILDFATLFGLNSRSAATFASAATVDWSADSQYLVVRRGADWWRLSLDIRRVERLPRLNGPGLVLTPDTALTIDELGILNAFSLPNQNIEAIATAAINPIPTPADRLIALDRDHVLLLDHTGTLRWFNPKSQLFEGLATRVRDSVFSPDRTKILWRTATELWVRSLTPEGQSELVTRLSSPLAQALWADRQSAHILFSTGDAVKAIELDARSGRNSADLISVNAPTVFLGSGGESLLIITAGSLKRLSLR